MPAVIDADADAGSCVGADSGAVTAAGVLAAGVLAAGAVTVAVASGAASCASAICGVATAASRPRVQAVKEEPAKSDVCFIFKTKNANWPERFHAFMDAGMKPNFTTEFYN